MSTLHSELIGNNLHEFAHYVASSDPGAVGAGKYWLDISVEPYALKRRNDSDTDWIDVGGGGSGGGAPTNAKYIVAEASSGLTDEIVIPGLMASADIAGAGGGGLDYEFDSSFDVFTWDNALNVVDYNTTVKSHMYFMDNSTTDRFGTIDWTPTGDFDVRCKIGMASEVVSGSQSFGLHIQNSDNSVRLLLRLLCESVGQMSFSALTYSGGSYSGVGTTRAFNRTHVYFRIVREGTTVRFSYSSDGILWHRIHGLTFAITVAKIGWRIQSTVAGNVYGVVDWLRADV
jgi:hypothetical protein